jgi:hypothetical protein
MFALMTCKVVSWCVICATATATRSLPPEFDAQQMSKRYQQKGFASTNRLHPHASDLDGSSLHHCSGTTGTEIVCPKRLQHPLSLSSSVQQATRTDDHEQPTPCRGVAAYAVASSIAHSNSAQQQQRIRFHSAIIIIIIIIIIIVAVSLYPFHYRWCWQSHSVEYCIE